MPNCDSAVDRERARRVRVACSLHVDVGVVGQRGRRRGLDRAGDHQAGVLAHLAEIATRSASPAKNPTRMPAMFERFDSEWTASTPSDAVREVIGGGRSSSTVNSA